MITWGEGGGLDPRWYNVIYGQGYLEKRKKKRKICFLKSKEYLRQKLKKNFFSGRTLHKYPKLGNLHLI